jgi:hypothetical protein
MTTTILTAGDTLRDCHDCHTFGLVSDERTRFFPQQLVGADDLTQDQVYFREKLRRHNRLMHGWGIVCGVAVRHEEGCTAIVSPGYVLGPYGDEVVIDQEVPIDVCKQESVGALDCVDPDLWCGDTPRVQDGATVYLAVRYVERPTRPVRVPGCACGCDERECEYSRTRDGFELKVLTELPTTYQGWPESPKDEREAFLASYTCRGQARACAGCPDEPWVVLCDLEVSGGEIVDLKCEPHRRYVVSFANYGFACPGS